MRTIPWRLYSLLAAVLLAGCEERQASICTEIGPSLKGFTAVTGVYELPWSYIGRTRSVWVCRVGKSWTCQPVFGFEGQGALAYQWQSDGRLKIVSSTKAPQYFRRWPGMPKIEVLLADPPDFDIRPDFPRAARDAGVERALATWFPERTWIATEDWPYSKRTVAADCLGSSLREAIGRGRALGDLPPE